MMEHSEVIVNFWFSDIDPALWWRKDDAFDAQVSATFGDLLKLAATGACAPWRESPWGRLAEILVLDQFSRNAYRNTPAAFAQDALALHCAQAAVAVGADRHLPMPKRAFLYMPYMHSEDQAVHQESVRLFNQPGLENMLNFAHQHKAIIDKFGRYPHRNSILGRESTAEEIQFLTQPHSSF
jgi:uncharacterized protein (DUF924 family)